jgi:hypothetical protein
MLRFTSATEAMTEAVYNSVDAALRWQKIELMVEQFASLFDYARTINATQPMLLNWNILSKKMKNKKESALFHTASLPSKSDAALCKLGTLFYR